jgi:CRP-like cAMP-binding protein
MEFLKKFSNWKDVEEHDAQTVIFSEGSPADVLYVILSGEVQLSLRGEPLETAGEGGLIGEMAIASSDTRSATATSITSVKLARIERDQFNQLMTESTEFSLHVMAELANRLRAVNRYIKNQFGPD